MLCDVIEVFKRGSLIRLNEIKIKVNENQKLELFRDNGKYSTPFRVSVEMPLDLLHAILAFFFRRAKYLLRG